MAGKRRKGEVVTFKADGTLLEAMRSVPNRSEFIRSAVLAALEGVCPVCRGTGVLTLNQRKHWQAFAANHSIEVCAECNEARLVCAGRRDSSQKGEKCGRLGRR